MSNKTLEGMARASLRIKTPEGFDRSTEHAKLGEVVGMRDALLWLADNVPFEMIRAAIEDRAEDDEQTYAALGDLIDFSGEAKTHTVVKSAISAALRAAAGSAPTPPEVK